MSKKNGLNTELLDNGMTLQTNYLNGLKSEIGRASCRERV